MLAISGHVQIAGYFRYTQEVSKRLGSVGYRPQYTLIYK